MARRRTVGALSIAAIAMASLVSASQQAAAQDSTTPAAGSSAPVDEGTPVMGGSLVISGEAEVTNPWTPKAMQCDSYCQHRIRTIYDPLAAIGEDGEPHPFLAESFTPNDDASEWTVKLRSGISFTDGTPLNADAAILNLQQGGQGFLLSGGLVDVAKVPDPGNPDAKVLKIDKLDDLTFKVYIGQGGDPAKPMSWWGFPYSFTTQWGLMASPKYLLEVAGGGDPTKAVGTGPFMLESYAPRQSMVVVRNPNYWMKDAAGNQLPYLDRIEFRVIEDSETAATALRSGDIDAFSTSAAAVVADFRDAKDFPMVEQSTKVETNYGLINLATPGPLQDRRVRCALSMAIDRQEYLDALDLGISTIANGLFSPGQEGYLEDNGFSTERNVEEATRLIEEYETETGTQVAIKWGTTVSQLNAQRAELIKGWWNEIGVDVEWEQVPQDSFITNALIGQFEVFGWRNHAGFKVDQQHFWWGSEAAYDPPALALNFARLKDPVVDAALAKARTSKDPAERKAAAEEINRQFAKECYQIPFTYTVWGTPHNARMHGFSSLKTPEGVAVLDGAGFSGAYWMTTVWVDAK